MRLPVASTIVLVIIALLGAGCGRPGGQADVKQSTAAKEADAVQAEIDKLVTNGKPSIPKLISMLRSSSRETQVAAAEALGRIGVPDERAIKALGRVLGNTRRPAWEIHEVAATSLGHLGPDAFPYLVAALSEHQWLRVARPVVRSIERLELTPTQALELVEARKRLVIAKANALSVPFAPPNVQENVTIRKTNAAGEVLSEKRYGEVQQRPRSQMSQSELEVARQVHDLATETTQQWDALIASLDAILEKHGAGEKTGD